MEYAPMRKCTYNPLGGYRGPSCPPAPPVAQIHRAQRLLIARKNLPDAPENAHFCCKHWISAFANKTLPNAAISARSEIAGPDLGMRFPRPHLKARKSNEKVAA